MSLNIVRDAVIAHLPPGTRPKPIGASVKYAFNCPCCHLRGEPTPDRQKKGAVFANADGSTTYSCFRCQMRAGQSAYRPLSSSMKYLLTSLGMGEGELTQLVYRAWQQHITISNGPLPKVTVAPKPLPSGAKSLGDWLDNPIADQNLVDVLDDLDGMTPERIKGFYWTPEPGPSGDMNRRFIEVYGDPQNPIGWSAVAISESDEPPIFSDDNIIHYMAEQEQKLEEEEHK